MGKSFSTASERESGSIDPDSTWYVAGEVRKWEEKLGIRRLSESTDMGDTTLFLGGPEFDESDIDDLPAAYPFFLPKHVSSKPDLSVEDQSAEVPSLEATELITSYDRIPRAPEPSYVYKSNPVRGKRARLQLPGQECKKCEEFFNAAGLSPTKRKEIVRYCSRHRAKHPRSRTPEGYWNMDMPSESKILRRQLGLDD